MSAVGEVKDIHKMPSGDLFVEIAKATQVKSIMTIKKFADVDVSVSPHRSLNFSRGVVSHSEFLYTPEEDILENLKSEGVVHVRRITIRRDGTLMPTKHLVLTFNSPELPKHIIAAYMRCSVRPYIPNPLRCFKCQRFGHSQSSCRGSVTCARCAADGHESENCTDAVKCVNCKGDHPAYAKSCPKWTFEKEVQAVKITNKMSYVEARQLVSSRTPQGDKTYAKAIAKTVVSVGTQTDRVPLIPTLPVFGAACPPWTLRQKTPNNQPTNHTYSSAG